MNIQINVTTENIEAAKGQDGVYNQCPIAQALRQLGYLNIDADEDRILLTSSDGQRLFCKTPREISLFIDRFDNGEAVSPSSFTISEIRPAIAADERSQQPSSINSEDCKKMVLENSRNEVELEEIETDDIDENADDE